MAVCKHPKNFFHHKLWSFSDTRTLPVMLVFLCCSQQLLNILSDLLSFPNHIFRTGQTGAGGCVGVFRDGSLALPDDAPLPALPAWPAKEQTRGRSCGTELAGGTTARPLAARSCAISRVTAPPAVSPRLPRLLQLQRGGGVVIVALRHAALLLQLRGLQQTQIYFSAVQERRAPRCSSTTTCRCELIL